MGDKVYIVTAGQYSDYHIVAVYFDEAAADAYAANRNRGHSYSDYIVQEWDVATAQTFSGMVWEGTWTRNSEKNYYSGQELATIRQVWHDGNNPGRAQVVKSRVDHWGGLIVVVRGISREHVEKALHDRAAQVKAEHMGVA